MYYNDVLGRFRNDVGMSQAIQYLKRAGNSQYLFKREEGKLW